MTAKKIRVLHIFRCLELGGLENRILRLAKGLDPNEFQIDFLTFRKTPFAPLEPPPTTRHTLFEMPPGIHLGRLLQLARLIRAGGYDIVHTHNWSVMFYGVLAARLAGATLVFHGEHGMDLENLHNTSWKRLLAQRGLARLADLVVCVNEFVADYNIERWRIASSKFKVIHNGVDLLRFRPTPRPAGAPVTIGTVARLVAVKDIPCLVDAFARVASRNVRLQIVGDGPELPALREQISRLGLGDKVMLPGEMRNSEAGYAQMDIFVNASRFEGMSNTILEAMACGLPVVASAVPGNLAWLATGENALLFPAGDAVELARRIERLLDDRALAMRMGEANRARVEREFDNARFLDVYRQTYLDSLKAKAA